MDKIGTGDALGAANATKLAYQSSRAARGLGLTTRLTAALDVGLGAAGMGTAGSAGGALMSGASAANGEYTQPAPGKKELEFLHRYRL